jgi:hypothetical protein
MVACTSTSIARRRVVYAVDTWSLHDGFSRGGYSCVQGAISIELRRIRRNDPTHVYSRDAQCLVRRAAAAS